MRGGHWELHCEEKVREIGFEPMGTCCEWRSVFWHPRLRVMLSIYVDDFKMAGPKDHVKEAWKLLSKKIKFGNVGAVDAYLGCKHEEGSIDVREFGADAGPDSESGTAKRMRTVRYIKYDMEEFLKP